LILQFVLTAAALLVAVAALLRARRVARRLDQVVESYWELRYQHGQLRAQLDQLEGKSAGTPPETGSPTAFVPLSSIRRT
jgi:hypothetical protein